MHNEKKILEKINILCLMEIVFSRPAEDRTISLSVIAERTKLSMEDGDIPLQGDFLAEHMIFGGNCDICTSSMKEKDLSRKAFLLMACIQSCGGCWGLNLPIGILRGSRSKKIIDAQFASFRFMVLEKRYLQIGGRNLLTN